MYFQMCTVTMYLQGRGHEPSLWCNYQDYIIYKDESVFFISLCEFLINILPLFSHKLLV